MIEINKTQEVNAPVEAVWKVISDLDNEHKNWEFLNDVKILSRSDNSVEREVKIRRGGPMGTAQSTQTLSVDPQSRSTTLELIKGPMLGTRKISLSKLGNDETQIVVDWNIEMKGVPGFAIGFVKDNVSDVTEKSLAQIAKVAEAQ